MKLTLLALSILLSTSAFATTEDDLTPPMTYALLPNVGLDLAYSELSGTSQVNAAGHLQIGFRMLREGYFFIPSLKVGAANGFAGKSPAPYWAAGFIAGGRPEFLGFDIFAGADYQTFVDYLGPPNPASISTLVDGTPIYKVGIMFDLGLSGIQVVVNGFYGQFTQHVNVATGSKLNVNYPYTGGEISLQYPIGL